MKRVICIILVTLCAFCLFARDKHVTVTEEGRLVEDLLEDGLYKNQDQILTIVPVMTPEELTILYEKNHVSPVKVPILNGLIGFGSGSFGAGDKKGGTIQLCCELGGAVLGVASLGYMVAYGFVGVIDAIAGKEDNAETIMGASAVGMIIGLGSFIGGRIYGIVRGIRYPLQYNRDLENTLYGSESALQISFAPAVSPSGIGFGVGVRF